MIWDSNNENFSKEALCVNRSMLKSTPIKYCIVYLVLSYLWIAKTGLENSLNLLAGFLLIWRTTNSAFFTSEVKFIPLNTTIFTLCFDWSSYINFVSLSRVLIIYFAKKGVAEPLHRAVGRNFVNWGPDARVYMVGRSFWYML